MARLLPSSTLSLLVLVGCASSGDPPAPGEDGGPPPGDAGTDAGPPPVDAGDPDAGDPDAGPSCACPALPPSCTPPAAHTPTFTPDAAYGEQLMAVLACADTSLDIAMYQTGWDCIAGAIEERLDDDPDLAVRIVIDDDQCPRVAGVLDGALSAIEGHDRVEVVDDARSRLMHHKLVIADGERVWVSSGNFTEQSFCWDFNNALVVERTGIVDGYVAQFEHLYVDRAFGPVDPADPIVDGPYGLYFSPETPLDDPSRWFEDLIAAIDAATTSVEFMISAWTRTEVSDALIAASDRGVTVRGIVSPPYADDAPAMALIDAGIPLRVDDVHSKVAVVDGSLAITGSPNWSANSWRNNENCLFVDDAAVAGAYADEIDRIFTSAEMP